MRRQRLLLIQVALHGCSLQLASVSLVLTYICYELGHSPFVSSILPPAFAGGSIVGSMLAPAALRRFSASNVMLGTLAATAALMAANAAWTDTTSGDVLAGEFLLTTTIMGLFSGMAAVAFFEALARNAPTAEGMEIVLVGTAMGGIVAVVLAVLLDTVVETLSAMLWAAAVTMAGAALLWVLIGRGRKRSATPHSEPIWSSIRSGWSGLRTLPWYRKFLLASILCQSITMARTFYSIAAANELGDDDDALSILVVMTCVALLAGSFLWKRAFRIYTTRYSMALMMLFSVISGIICLSAAFFRMEHAVWIYGAAVTISTVAGQSVYSLTYAWATAEAESASRADLVSFSQVLNCVFGLIAGAVLGLLAQYSSTSWPIVVIGVVSVVSVPIVYRIAPARIPAEKQPERVAGGVR